VGGGELSADRLGGSPDPLDDGLFGVGERVGRGVVLRSAVRPRFGGRVGRYRVPRAAHRSTFRSAGIGEEIRHGHQPRHGGSDSGHGRDEDGFGAVLADRGGSPR